jgi:hypothetical protein
VTTDAVSLLRFVADVGGKTSLLALLLAEIDIESLVDAVKADWVSYQEEDGVPPTIELTPKGWEVLEHPASLPPI